MPKDKNRPPHIEAAIERGDTEYLSRCGRNGARRTNQIKRAKKRAQTEDERAEQRAILEAARARRRALREAERVRQQALIEAQRAQEIAAQTTRRLAEERTLAQWWEHHVRPSNCHIIDPDGNDLNYCEVGC